MTTKEPKRAIVESDTGTDHEAAQDAPASDNPAQADVALSDGLGGCYTMIDGKRVRVTD